MLSVMGKIRYVRLGVLLALKYAVNATDISTAWLSYLSSSISNAILVVARHSYILPIIVYLPTFPREAFVRLKQKKQSYEYW